MLKKIRDVYKLLGPILVSALGITLTMVVLSLLAFDVERVLLSIEPEWLSLLFQFALRLILTTVLVGGFYILKLLFEEAYRVWVDMLAGDKGRS